MYHYQRTLLPLTKTVKNFEFKYITSDRYKDVMQHIAKICSDGHTSNRTFCESIKKGGNEFIEYFLNKTLKDNVSLMALNKKDQIVGVVLNGILQADDLEGLKFYINRITDPQLKRIMLMQIYLNTANNIFDLFSTKKVFEIRLLSVENNNYNGRILGEKLIKRSEKLASNRKHKVIKSDASGSFTQKILSSCGFKCLHERYYNPYIEEKPLKSWQTSTMPLTKYQLLYKMLK